MKENPLITLESFGQSIWMDYLRRDALTSEELQKYIREDGLSGVTSNPSIFEKAISGSQDYDAAIRALTLEGKDVYGIYLGLVIDDIQHTADLFRPHYDQTQGQDGFVSLEVSPYNAHDTEGTMAEAHRLWDAVNRPNVMIKVPGTLEGLPAIRALIRDGINVNITLLFGLPRYRKVADAYLSGLEDRQSDGKPIDQIASVASFFLSRIDTLVDPILEKKALDRNLDALADQEHGQIAIASAKQAYQIFKEIYNSVRYKKLASHGARKQRLLWASTSTKNPSYYDLKYVEPLIGPDTINTLPLETLDLYRDHGDPSMRIEDEVPKSKKVLDSLPKLGIDIDQITQILEDDGVKKFSKSFDTLMSTLDKRRKTALAEPVNQQSLSLHSYSKPVQDRVAALEKDNFIDRMWRKDATLWKTDPVAQSEIRDALGWLHVAEKMEENLDELMHFVAEVKAAGYKHVVHLGMGGSSLAALVFERTFKPEKDGLDLTVLDTTDPTTILKVEKANPPGETLYIVASKSGTTAEPLAYGDYFYHILETTKGQKPGDHFVAITDPDTPLVNVAKDRGFRKVFINFADIGGRFSALSYFGLVPAALYGINIGELLERSLRMQHACVSAIPAAENPGLMLGATLGELGRLGRDKVTFIMPERIASLGMWLEQLLAESTGKEGTGLLPVSGEPVGPPASYGQDRLFVYFRLADAVDNELDRRTRDLEEAGQPVITIQLTDRFDIGQEFYRWEIATAVAGAILGINAFDQPNVQESKDNTNRTLKYYTENGDLPEKTPTLEEENLKLVISQAAENTIATTLRRIFSQSRPGDYVAFLLYLPESTETEQALQPIRLRTRDHLKVATTLGYGPRYLHSTGQYHKGGPNTGIFLVVVGEPPKDASLPGRPYSFGIFNRAQALGDYEALENHKRRVVLLELGKDINKGLKALNIDLETAFMQNK